MRFYIDLTSWFHGLEGSDAGCDGHLLGRISFSTGLRVLLFS